ncbi:hypothetical protein, conserved [Leishmania tarentolae]|uniref:SET domain-containing protein n=1 Tax=Leishmania tarentolae TaxID=5689 RepID=A0A640KPZ0_LEITA|nr:hypothetical protein, conserved [Leishmania tarentolae]
MEYDEHVKRFQHYMRRLHAVWWAAYASATGQGSGAEVASEAAPRADTTATLGSSVPTLGVDEEGSATLVTIDTEGIDSKDIGNRAVVPADAKASNMDSSAAQMAWRPPPSVEDMVWALRVILSRQKVLPHLRVDRTALAHVREENVEGEVLDSFGKAVMKGKYSFYQHILHAIDEDRLHVNEVDPTAIPTLVPLLDMVSHPPGGVPNVSYTVEKVEGTGEGADALLVDVNESSDRAALMRGKSPRAPPCYQLVVRATDDIEEDEELTASYVKCYSVAYTLYRYGFLPLSRREDDVAALLEANRVDGNTRPVPTGGSSPSSLSRDCVRSVFRSWWPSMFAQ